MKRVTSWIVLPLLVGGIIWAMSRFAYGGDRASVKAIPRIVQWNGHQVVEVKLLVRVSDPYIRMYCIFWLDGEESCRDVDEEPYSEYLVHKYKTCVFDGDPRNGPINRIVVAFGDERGDKVLQLSADILFAGCE